MASEFSAPGVDRFGAFTIEDGFCEICGDQAFVVTYEQFEALGYDEQGPISPKHLIIGETKKDIGVTCGCYGRLHRQVGHIVTEQKYRHR